MSVKVSIESDGLIASVESEDTGVVFEELMDMVKQVCLAVGYHPNTVDEYWEDGQ